jgi:ABC-type phosphate transport system auxiliary subunit
MGVSQRVNAALTDLNAYVLTLDLERLRLDNRLREIAKSESSMDDWHPLLRERDELGEELAALRAAISALREQISP